ncbi:MAG: glycosyltransferase family 9 protein [Candidatus Adiutrix sp.]|jgi:heptosyltransferase-3|nr:glycosyltransferase family 9 protein [Candidatus Adiutrix sp.]
MEIKKALVISIKHLGDVVTTTCVLPLLRENWPGLEIHYLVNPEAAPLVAAHPLAAKVFTTGRREGAAAAFKLARALRREKYDLALDYSESDRGAFWGLVSGAGLRVGYRSKPAHLFRNLSHTHLLPDRSRAFGRHISACHSQALAALGRPAARAPLPRLYYTEAGRNEARELLGRHQVEGLYAAAHFTAHDAVRLWPAESCAEAANWLAARVGPVFVVSGRNAGERDFVASILAQSRGRVIDPGPLSLDTLMALLDGAALFMGLDSVVGHMAGALGRPVVSIFGPASEVHWAPRGPRVRVAHSGRPCRPCVTGGCLGHYRSACLRDLSFEDHVRPLAEDLLQ